MDGKQTGLADLKLGTVLTATLETVTKPVEVKTTTIKDGEVVKVQGGTLTTKEADGFHNYNVPAGFKFNVDGRETGIENLSPGMKLNATIVTTSSQMTPETKRGPVSGAAPAPPPTAAPAVAAAPAPAPTPAPVAEAKPAKKGKKLPKTAGPLPLLALLGASSLAAGAGLRAYRRSN